MNAKRLIEHARDILLCYELKQLGIPTPLDPESMKANGNVFQIGDRWKRDLREPILFDEEEFLQEFCTTRGVRFHGVWLLVAKAHLTRNLMMALD